MAERGIDYVCVDCEASGPVPGLYNLLSIGATMVREREDGIELGDSFYVELKPIFPGFDAGALEVCGLDPDVLRRDGVEPSEAMARFRDWLVEQGATDDGPPVFVGHNAVFDWGQVSYYFAHAGLENPFGYKGLDTKSLAMGVLGIQWSETSKERLETALALPPQDDARLHRADYDAWYQALILQALLRRHRAGRVA